MQIRVEHDNREGQDKDGVGRPEARDDVLVAAAVPRREHLHEPLDLLRFSGHPEVRLELPQSDVDGHAAEIELRGEALQDCHVEGALEIPEVLADHLLAEALPRDEEARHPRRRVLQESSSNQVADAALGFLVEQV